VEFYGKLMPYCEKFDIKIATENMWQYDDKRKIIIESTCGTPEEFNRYVDAVNNENLVACLDLGHCGLIGEDAAYMIRTIGHDRLQALHVHDNDHLHDSHTAPYCGKMDWDAIAQALADIDYTGVFTFEADDFYSSYPDEFFPTCAKFLHDIGRLLISKIEAAKK
jgi:sugar phosphate isomerase/epimerase